MSAAAALFAAKADELPCVIRRLLRTEVSVGREIGVPLCLTKAPPAPPLVAAAAAATVGPVPASVLVLLAACGPVRFRSR